MTKKDECWADLVRELSLDLSRPTNIITEQQIKGVLRGRIDLRILVSMNTLEDCPVVLKTASDGGVFVLPLSRKKWALTHGKGYHTLEDPGEPRKFTSKLPFRLTTTTYGKGEGAALFYAYNSGLLNYFSETPTIFPTDPGRGSTMPFTFHVDGYPDLEQDGAQMEIDQLFEGPGDVLLIEAKVGWRDTFHIRQLYYPYRSHRLFQETAERKRVRPLFFIHEPSKGNPDESTYSFWEYSWDDDLDYEAIRLKSCRRFRVVEEMPPEDLLRDVSPDPSVPFFQANDLYKVAELPFLIPQGVRTAKDWARLKGFALRQGSYYRAAAEALGLVRSEQGEFVLTREGKTFVTRSQTERNSWMAERLLKIPILNAVFELAQQRGAEGVNDSDISRIIKEKTTLTGKTPPRRASSVRSYFRWLAQTTGTVVVEKQQIYSRSGWDKKRG